MSNPFTGSNRDGHGGHAPSGSQLGGFFTSYDEVLDRIEFGVSFECGCELMTALTLEQARLMRNLFDAALFVAINHRKERN